MSSSSSSSSSPSVGEEIMEMPHEFMEFPLGFVIDSGGSVTKLLFRSNEDYRNGQILKKTPNGRGLLRLKYFNWKEIDRIPQFLKDHCDICGTETANNTDVSWWMTGITTQHFKSKLQAEFGIKIKLYSEMLALNASIKSFNSMQIGHYAINLDILKEVVKIIDGVVKAMKGWSEMGDDFLKDYLKKPESLEDDLGNVDISDTKKQENEQQQQQQQQQQEPPAMLPPALELISNPNIDLKEWSDNNLESPQGKLVTPCLLTLFGSGCGILMIDDQMTIKPVDFIGTAGKAFCGIVEEMIGVDDFDVFMKMAENGNIHKVSTIFSDLKNPDHQEDDWYSMFPEDFVAFEMGRMSSGYALEKGNYSKDDVAAGILSYQAANISKALILNSKLHKIQTIYLCGSFVKFQIARKMIEKHFFLESIRNTLEGSPLVKLHFLHNPGFLVGLGVWLANVQVAKDVKNGDGK